MKETLDNLPSQLPEFFRATLSSLIEIQKKSGARDLDKLIEKLSSTTVSQLHNIVIVEEEGLFKANDLNNFYANVTLDLQALYVLANEVDLGASFNERSLENKFNQITKRINNSIEKLESLKFLKQNLDFSDAIVDGISNTINETEADNQAAVNLIEHTVTLRAIKTQQLEIEKFEDIEVSTKVLGNGISVSLPSFAPSMALDKNELTAWSQVVLYHRPQQNPYSPTTDAVILASDITLSQDARSGETMIFVSNGAGIPIGSNIVIGLESNTEVVSVSSTDGARILVTPLLNNHKSGEAILVGQNVLKSDGALLTMNIKFKYIKALNFMKIIPFADFPVTLRHITYSVNGIWVEVQDFKPINTIDPMSISFDTIYTDEIRLIFDQENYVINTFQVKESDIANQNIAGQIFENEFDDIVDSIQKRVDKISALDNLSNVHSSLRHFHAGRLDLGIETDKRTPDVNLSVDEVVRNNISKFSSVIAKSNLAAQKKIKDQLGNVDDIVQDRLITIKRYEYTFGASEIELFNNNYLQNSEFLSKAHNPSAGIESIELVVDEEIAEDTAIHYSIELKDGLRVPVANSRSRSLTGSVEIKPEVLDVDKATLKARLRFKPSTTAISISMWKPESKETFSVNHVDRVITIPTNKFHINAMYTATYSPVESDALIEQNTASEITSQNFTSTDENKLVKLKDKAQVEKFIINDEVNWKKVGDGIWEYIFFIPDGGSVEVDGFPVLGTVVDNKYYGPAASNPIERTETLREFLITTVFAAQQGNQEVLSERFINKFEGIELEESVLYTPITVFVDGVLAHNITNYLGSEIQFEEDPNKTYTYIHQDNILQFNIDLPAADIIVSYNLKNSSFRFAAELFCARNSMLNITPKLRRYRLGIRS